MLRLIRVFAALVAVFSVASLASAQTAFVEGHVFNIRTGAPLPGATVRVTENITAGPLPIELAVGVTDENGFYQFEIDDFLGAPAIVEVACLNTRREVRGKSTAALRDGVIRRDVYLKAGRHIKRCQLIETQ
jgi:hypothetical protein